MIGWRVMRAVFARTWRKVIRRPVPLLLSFVQPLIWMLFFGFLFHRFNLGPSESSLAYIDFILPGICAMTVLLGASQSGISLIRDIQIQFLPRLLATPAGPQWLLMGKVAADVTRLLAQAAVVGLLGLVLGAKVQTTVWPVLLAVSYLGVFATGYACLSCSIALRTQSQESMAAFVHVVNMPLFFTSTALVPTKHMPLWLETVAVWNPFSVVVNTMRQALLSGVIDPVLPTLGPLVLLTAVLFGVAWRAMKAAV